MRKASVHFSYVYIIFISFLLYQQLQNLIPIINVQKKKQYNSC